MATVSPSESEPELCYQFVRTGKRIAAIGDQNTRALRCGYNLSGFSGNIR